MLSGQWAAAIATTAAVIVALRADRRSRTTRMDVHVTPGALGEKMKDGPALLISAVNGVFVFLFRSLDDGPCHADEWYEDVAGAERHVAEKLGVEDADWQLLPDPLPGRQHDRIAPVRITWGEGRDT
jgi:hypothetical protein